MMVQVESIQFQYLCRKNGASVKKCEYIISLTSLEFGPREVWILLQMKKMPWIFIGLAKEPGLTSLNSRPEPGLYTTLVILNINSMDFQDFHC